MFCVPDIFLNRNKSIFVYSCTFLIFVNLCVNESTVYLFICDVCLFIKLSTIWKPHYRVYCTVIFVMFWLNLNETNFYNSYIILYNI